MERLKSRKLWIAVIGSTYFALQGQYAEAMAIIMTYLGTQSIVDVLKN